MERVISATELVRTLGDVLARIRYRRESFVIERNGTPVARVLPVEPAGIDVTVGEALANWSGTRGQDRTLGEDLARVNAADRPAANPWA
jgi:antitoxin (DNA-binding transcriptional repressor) of toxin-antitoxin stability system